MGVEKVVSGVVLSYGKLLLVRKKGIYIPPGGKLINGESDEDCLRREFREELSDTEIDNIHFYKELRGVSPHSNKLILVRLYFTDIVEQLGNPSREIESADWIPFINIPHYNLSSLTAEMVSLLNKDYHYGRMVCDGNSKPFLTS